MVIKSNIQPNLPDDLVEVGYVLDAYGLAGWVKIKPHATDSQTLLATRQWWLSAARHSGVATRLAVQTTLSLADYAVMQSKLHAGTIVAQLMGVADRDQAEKLKGATIYVRRAHFPAPDNNEFYWIDLVGCAVQNEQGECLGVVDHLIDHGAHPVLVVGYTLDNKPLERLIPFVDAFIKKVDIDQKQIVVDWGVDY